MRILAVDTATRSCSVAIVDDEAILAELTMVSNQTHTRHLMGAINKVIRLAGVTLMDVDGFAVGRGPGSFTGLRIGISAIKALATAVGKPVVGVSNLDALAMQATVSPFVICPLMDARKGEVYFSIYRYEQGELKNTLPVQIARPAQAIGGINERCIFVGEGAALYRETIVEMLGSNACFAATAQNVIRASTIASMGLHRLKENDTDDIAELVPDYIRKSDAELNFCTKKTRKIKSPFA